MSCGTDRDTSIAIFTQGPHVRCSHRISQTGAGGLFVQQALRFKMSHMYRGLGLFRMVIGDIS